jgi:UDPglucose 6-dehydrogenase
LRVAIIGSGRVGLVTGGCLAATGHDVVCADRDSTLIAELEAGRLPIYEPHLDEALRKAHEAGRLTFTGNSRGAATSARIIFLCVGVPPLESGDVDLSALDAAARQIAPAIDSSKLVVLRTTVPVQTGEQLRHLLAVYGHKPEDHIHLAANPQLLREGKAVDDFLHPHRILVGVAESSSAQLLRDIYAPILERKFSCPVHAGSCPPRRPPEILVTSIQSAELIKYVTNSFLALKISYANVLADLCEQLGGNVQEVSRAMGLDARIGPEFLDAGLGFGGPRLPKDLQAFLKFAESSGVDLGILQGANRVNCTRVDSFFRKIEQCLWVLKEKRIALLGLAYTLNTDDIRGSQAIELWKRLTAAGVSVSAYDPRAMTNARAEHPSMTCAADAYQAAERADALIIATDCEEFKALDWQRIHGLMTRPTVLDGRNLLSPPAMQALGFEYHSVGRPG